MQKIVLAILFLSAIQLTAFGQKRKPKPIVKDSLSSEAFLLMVESSLESFYADYATDANYDSIINALEFEPNEVPEISDDIICERLNRLNEISSFHFDCNPTTISVIRFFNKSRRGFIRIAMGRSKLYFDMYEHHLVKNELPKELRFLSVIESGLRPQVKSPAGALGLWQFMYGTGKMYGLKDNAYLDERMDPVKSTEAACKYLKKLYDIYGDWNLALAAYNAGPGNINKAIRRSGGKRTYWEVRPFLPRETQGYVPNFIAACYLMTYHAEHNLVPMEAKIHSAQLDTMCLKRGVHMETIAKLTAWDVDDIKMLNPVFKKTYIPATLPGQCITGPLMKIGKLVSLEDSLYALEKNIYGNGNQPIIQTPVNNSTAAPSEIKDSVQEDLSSINFINHKVRKGETLTKIALKYKVTNRQIIEWNNLRTSKVPVGKILKIGQPVKEALIEVDTKSDSIMGTVFYDSLVTIYHVVQRNESLDFIATKYKVSVENIKTWNNLKDTWINLDQRLLIITTIKISKPGMVANPNKVAPGNTNELKPKPETPQKKYYTVKSGDLFNRIAQKHGLTTQQLQKLNPSVKPDRINVGQKLRVK